MNVFFVTVVLLGNDFEALFVAVFELDTLADPLVEGTLLLTLFEIDGVEVDVLGVLDFVEVLVDGLLLDFELLLLLLLELLDVPANVIVGANANINTISVIHNTLNCFIILSP